MKIKLAQLLLPYREKIETEIQNAIERMGEKNSLRDACEYALTNGGKRLRPLIVFAIAEALQSTSSVSHAALSVEFFHTASLIADDLPCMDNDDWRRKKPSLHKKYGESIAILASYTLIAAGYEQLYLNAQLLSENSAQICTEALAIISKRAGIEGATNGQFLDLFPPDCSLKTLTKTIYQKTITLFEICFALGWLYGGGAIAQLDAVLKCAYHFGMAFQIADDLQDITQDGDTGSNLASHLGEEKALQLFEREYDLFQQSLYSLNLSTPTFEIISELLNSLARS